MITNEEYNLFDKELDMERSKEYDLAIKNTIEPCSDSFEEENGVYLGKAYREQLICEIKKYGWEDQFKNEYSRFYGPNKTKCKMCSIASSSRLCFIEYKDVEGIEFEKIIDNGNVCKPHLDAFNKSTATYYECKCHEIVNTHSVMLSAKYRPLLKKYFHIQCDGDGDIALDYKTFGICDIKLKCGKYFDFKQFICHIIGLITLPEGPKPTLQYVFFKPDSRYLDANNTLKRWKKEFEEIEQSLFLKLREMKVYKNGNEYKLKDLINLPFPISINVSDVDDDLMK